MERFRISTRVYKKQVKKDRKKKRKKGVSFDGFAYSDGQIADDLV